MEGTRNYVSSYSELGMPTMFATYAKTPPFAQVWLHTNRQIPNFLDGMDHPQQDSVYYVHNPCAKASSFAAHDGHQDAKDQEPQPSQQEQPIPEERRRNPTKHKRRPRCGTRHCYSD
ncbi:hypothetical protein DEO72_LG7g1893 [Vigna unguiculata]|uniref:Uncharacterized protein n=1 Tax=Vigna unguiculata TaxID=3917 RepID=A0A4D6MGP6_VIGUN|nr:hypothetical protein DEO72_LG7g1893 [Vigna unguiculata]